MWQCRHTLQIVAPFAWVPLAGLRLSLRKCHRPPDDADICAFAAGVCSVHLSRLQAAPSRRVFQHTAPRFRTLSPNVS
eukprot:s6096_g4.t1